MADPEGGTVHSLRAPAGRGPLRPEPVLARAPLCPDPRALAATLAGDRLYVAGSAGLAVFAGPSPRATVRLAQLRGIRDLALDEEAGALFVAAGGVARLDLATGAIEAAADGLASAEGLALAPDRRWLYVSDPDAGLIRALELPGGRERVVCAGLARPRAVAVTPAGLVVADAGRAAVVGVNLRHGTSTTIWQGAPLVEPSGVAFCRPARCYLVADPGAGRLLRVAVDGSACF